MVEQISRIAIGNAKPAGIGVSRISSLDVMKCFAAFCVVCIHSGNAWEWSTPIIRCAVPIFFIITGYYYHLLLDKGKIWKHIRKLLVMALCASVLYGFWKFQYQMRHGSLEKWISSYSLSHIIELLVTDNDMFGPHLWYFWAVLYDLLIFYVADKWKQTKWLRYITPILFLLLFCGNFTPWYTSCFRNFFFMGLPCMMIGRIIQEKQTFLFSLFSRWYHICLVTIISLVFIVLEMTLLDGLYRDNGIREMYIFTIPLVIPYFILALRNPDFGNKTVFASIGRRYSAYIYIVHPWVQDILSHHFVSQEKVYFPFIVFAISLLMAWLFTKILAVCKSK